MARCPWAEVRGCGIQVTGTSAPIPSSVFSVAKAPAASSTLDAAHIAAAIFLPLVAMALLVGGVYLYFSR